MPTKKPAPKKAAKPVKKAKPAPKKAAPTKKVAASKPTPKKAAPAKGYENENVDNAFMTQFPHGGPLRDDYNHADLQVKLPKNVEKTKAMALKE